MSLSETARTINATAYSYISSWALLTAAELRVFDRLPARSSDLGDIFPDADLVDTWMLTLADAGLVESDGEVWTQTPEMTTLLSGDNSYADYLGGQIMQQMTPRLTLGHTGENVLAAVLTDPASRRGYEGWFADADEAYAYQSSQYAGSLGPASALAKALPEPAGRVLDLGGGWGAIAQAVAKRHNVDVDVVDFGTVVASAPAGSDRVNFVEGNALDPSTWPDADYDGVVLSYLFSSIPDTNTHRYSQHSPNEVFDGLRYTTSWPAPADGPQRGHSSTRCSFPSTPRGRNLPCPPCSTTPDSPPTAALR